jgi:hypothetical protein
MFLYFLVLLAQPAIKTPDGNMMPLDIMGTWNVTSTPSGFSTCKDAAEHKMNSVYQWLIAVNGSTVEVSVLGSTSFPKLKGNVTGTTLVVTGSVGASTSIFRLRIEDLGKRITGYRYWVGPNAPSGSCMSEFNVTATR